MNYFYIFLTSLLFGSIRSISISNAQSIPYNQEFQVNTYTNSNQQSPTITCLSDGKLVVCWESFGQNGSETGIYGQIINSDFSRYNNEFQINTYSDFLQESPYTSTLVDSGFVTCWIGYRNDGSGYGIYCQAYDNKGLKRGMEFRVNNDTTVNDFRPDKLYPTVSSLTDSGFVVCWQSYLQDGSGYGIYCQLYNTYESERGNEFIVNTHTENDQYRPDVCSLNDNRFVVCWQSSEQGGSGDNVFGQIFYSDGSRYGDEFQVNTIPVESSQTFPNISNLAEGGFVICWARYTNNTDEWDIFCQIFNSDGSKRGSEFRVNSFTQSWQENPNVCYLADGGFVVLWQSREQDESGYGIYCQLFTKDGVKSGFEFRINSTLHSEQQLADVTSLKNDGFAVCWQSFNQDGSGWGVYSKYFLNEINHPLQTFSLLTPGFDSTLNETCINLKWQTPSKARINLPWEIEYTLFLDQDENFSSPTIIDSIYDTTYTVQNLTPGMSYFWKVLAKNIAGDSLWSSETFGFFVDYDATGIEQIPNNKIQSFKLYTNYPNPFNPNTTIRYDLPEQSNVNLAVYDLSGRLLQTLVNERQTAGSHKAVFNANGLSSGVYFYSIKAGQYRETKKMLLVR